MTTINPASSATSTIMTKPITTKGGGGAIDFSSLITASVNQSRWPKQPIKVGPGQEPAPELVAKERTPKQPIKVGPGQGGDTVATGKTPVPAPLPDRVAAGLIDKTSRIIPSEITPIDNTEIAQPVPVAPDADIQFECKLPVAEQLLKKSGGYTDPVPSETVAVRGPGGEVSCPIDLG